MTEMGWPITLARARLFVVSYAPLALMFAARFLAQDRWQLAIAFALAGVWGFVDGWRLVKGTVKRSKREVTITSIAGQGGAVSGYLATYLLPFLGNLPDNWGDWTAYCLYFATALVVYVRSDLAVVNPTLYALGYHLVRGSIEGRSVLVISCASLQENDLLKVSEAMDVVVAHKISEARPK